METARLLIRAFVPDDLRTVHRILDQTLGNGDKVEDEEALLERQAWLGWSILNQEWMPKIYEMPYGDVAVVLKATDTVIGIVGYVPILDQLEQILELAPPAGGSRFRVPEIGLFWAIDPACQRQGYATEAARAMVEHAFRDLHLKRILATTEYTNAASQAVMRKLGMLLTRNPLPEPPWLQIVGVLQNSG